MLLDVMTKIKLYIYEYIYIVVSSIGPLMYDNTVLFHNDFFLSGEQPEYSILAHELKQPTASCIGIFHKYCCYTKCGVLQQIWLYEINWGMLLMCHNTTMLVYEARIKTYWVFVKKTYSIFGKLL